MDIKLDSEQLTRVLEGAVINALGEVGKEALVKEVVRYLTTKSNSSYRDAASPLFEALQNAARIAATNYFHQRLESDPEFVAALDGLYLDAFKRFNSTEQRDKLIEKMASRLSSAFEDKY